MISLPNFRLNRNCVPKGKRAQLVVQTSDSGNEPREMMRHQDRTIRSVGDYIAALRDTTREGVVWFRGQKCEDWQLLPNIARPTENAAEGLLDQELPAIKRFKQNAGAFLSRLPQDEWEWIFLMQHHRGLTRLLDWTESPLVALYFALADCEEEKDGAVWCLDPIDLNAQVGHRRVNDRDVLAFGVDEVLDNYRPDRLSGRGAVVPPVAAIGPRNSARMIAQSGTFTIISSDRIPIEEFGTKNHVWRLKIPAENKADLREELKLLGFNEFMLFPDLETLALHTKELLR